MYDLKWTERDFIWKHEVPLKHAVARYHAYVFLNLKLADVYAFTGFWT